MSLALLFHYLLLNMFWMLMTSSSSLFIQLPELRILQIRTEEPFGILASK